MNLAFSTSNGVVIFMFSSSPLIKDTSESVGVLNVLYIDESSVKWLFFFRLTFEVKFFENLL